jgi:hypothetical protein
MPASIISIGVCPNLHIISTAGTRLTWRVEELDNGTVLIWFGDRHKDEIRQKSRSFAFVPGEEKWLAFSLASPKRLPSKSLSIDRHLCRNYKRIGTDLEVRDMPLYILMFNQAGEAAYLSDQYGNLTFVEVRGGEWITQELNSNQVLEQRIARR